MLGRILTITAGSIASATLMYGMALAQSPPSSKSTPSTSRSGQAQPAQDLPKEIHQKLTSQGFTDVKVVPGSYLVSAKDKNGDPVSMVIGPHSMTMFTTMSSDTSESTAKSPNPSPPKAAQQ